VRAAPAVSYANGESGCAHEHTGSAEASGIPCVMVLRLMPRSPRRRIRLVTVVGGFSDGSTRSGLNCHRRLGTSNGCQDHTVLPYATTSFVLRACNRSRGSTRPATAIRADALASTTSHPAFVTTRDRPSCRNGTAAVKPLIWAFGEAKSCPSCHLAATRRARSEYLRHSGTRHFGAGPESITTDREYGFRARADARPGMTVFTLSLRANGSRECALDDRLREAIHGVTEAWIASSLIAPRNDG
jgi:hypothetical protein